MQYPTYPPGAPTVATPQMAPRMTPGQRRGIATAAVVVVTLVVIAILAMTLPTAVTSARGLAYPKPKVSITASQSGTARVGESISFSATTSAGNDLTYSWDFGDGSTGSGQTATHAYQEYGQETITLSVSDPIGQRATATTAVTVNPPPPTAALSCTETDDFFLEVQCDGSQSTGANASYSLDWGDNSTPDSSPSSYHFYSAAGSYTITLTVTDAANQTATATQTVNVVQQ